MFHRLYQINKNFNLLMKLIVKKRYYVMSQKKEPSKPGKKNL